MVANPKGGGKKVSSVSPSFPAIVGQVRLKRALLTVVANDALGGALLVGEKGTAKSTAVRALADLLPEQRVVADCPYGCSPDELEHQCRDCRTRDPDELPVETRPTPLVTLPLGATRDRVVGTLSVEDALAGEADFDPGVLASAHRGILYVDEVNLLGDHLVDVLLDVAASGRNVVERDGVSVSHPAEFTLIGTMNPEEGELRPQLRDRFDLQATVTGTSDLESRIEIIDRALERTENAHHDADGDSECEYEADIEALRTTLRAASASVSSVTLGRDRKTDIAALCLEAGVDGHRGDIATARTAKTLAALEGRSRVTESDVREAASYTLPHRLRSTPFEESPDLEELLEEQFDSDGGEGSGSDGSDGSEDGSEDGDEADDARDANSGGESADEPTDEPDSQSAGGSSTNPNTNEPRPDSEVESEADAGTETGTATATATDLESESVEDEGDNQMAGDDETAENERDPTPTIPGQKRTPVEPTPGVTPSVDGSELETPAATTETVGDTIALARATNTTQGPRVRTEPTDGSDPIDVAASVRAAVSDGRTRVESDDLKHAVRTSGASATVVFAVDASASMRPAMRAAKGVVLEFLRESYQRRDEVAVVAFAGAESEVLLPPTTSVSLAARHLKDLPTGDRTPLPDGLETACQVLERAESDVGVLVLVTDGRANATECPTQATRVAARGLAESGACDHVLVIDAGDRAGTQAGLNELIAAETDGDVVSLSELSLETVQSAVGDAVSDGDLES